MISPLVPPYCSGMMIERNPWFPKAVTRSQGNSPVASISAGPGLDDFSGSFCSSLANHLSLFFHLLHGDILVEDRVGILCKK